MKAQLLDLFTNEPSLDNFITVNNQIIIDALKNNENQFIHIVGVKSSGKTHLLKAWVNGANANHKSAIYIDANLQESEQELRQLATYYQYIAIDNVEALNEHYQIELFDLFNSIKLNNRNNLLLTSSAINLENNQNIRADLKTRILSGLTLQLKMPSDEEIIETLQNFKLNQGISIDDSELSYMITHYTRNIGILINTINKIAEFAVLEKRNITIPLIKQVINTETYL
ncbi:MAG: HdaA/DnaA family protein [Neisseriaceae bacterium]